MRVVVLYRGQSDHERQVLSYEQDYYHQTGRRLELQDVNTRDGLATATLYDVTRYPTVLALGNDGQLHQMWAGESLPLISEVTYYDNN